MTHPELHKSSPAEKARKANFRILQAMQKSGTGAALAAAMNTSESTISRLKNEGLEPALDLIYHLGFKVVSADKYVVDQDELKVLRAHYARSVATNAAHLDLFGDME